MALAKFLIAETDVEEASGCKQNFDADNYWIVTAVDGFAAIELVKLSLVQGDPEYYKVFDEDVRQTWEREDRGGGKVFEAMRLDGEMCLLYTAQPLDEIPHI